MPYSQREDVFFPLQKELSWREWLSCHCQNGMCFWHIGSYQRSCACRVQRTEPKHNYWDHNHQILTRRLINKLITPTNRAQLSSTESVGYWLRQIHLPLNTLRSVRLRGNLHCLLDPHLFDCCKGDLMPGVDGQRQWRDGGDGPACCMHSLQP